MRIFAGGTVREVPDGNPGSSDSKCGPNNPHRSNKDEIKDDIEDESDSENFDSLLDPAHSRKYLKVYL